MTSNATDFIRLMTGPLRFRMFLLTKLPSAYFAGVRIREMNENTCKVTVPFKWFSQNPFRSTYFACLSMAAEMSTGALAMAYTHQSVPAISMLVLKIESQYLKKATGKTTFTCNDGAAFRETVERALATGEGQLFAAHSSGTNEAGETVAEFLITWSFKAKKNAGLT